MNDFLKKTKTKFGVNSYDGKDDWDCNFTVRESLMGGLCIGIDHSKGYSANLNRNKIKEIIPLLQKFVDQGNLE